MIKTNTLFILGAGASNPFGYPTSIKLRHLIRKSSRNGVIVNALKYPGDSTIQLEHDVHQFINEFSSSGLYSIDYFLEHRTEYMNIGKMAIATYLIPYEVDEELRNPDKNWYMYLYDRLKSSFDEIAQSKISFITFNYDRSLEHFLFTAMQSTFKKSDQECAEKLKKIPIVHLYGQLDPLPWQDKNGMAYSSEANLIRRVRNARINLKLINDERNIIESPEFQQAHKLISEAEKIYFLGFGFDETNLERLKIYLMKDKSFIGTSSGLSSSKLRWICGYFDEYAKRKIELIDIDVLSFLQDYLDYE